MKIRLMKIRLNEDETNDIDKTISNFFKVIEFHKCVWTPNL